jgi:hypothetical protein
MRSVVAIQADLMAAAVDLLALRGRLKEVRDELHERVYPDEMIREVAAPSLAFCLSGQLEDFLVEHLDRALPALRNMAELSEAAVCTSWEEEKTANLQAEVYAALGQMAAGANRAAIAITEVRRDLLAAESSPELAEALERFTTTVSDFTELARRIQSAEPR